MRRSRLDDLVMAFVGQDRQGESAIGRVGLALDPALDFETTDRARETRQGGTRIPGENAHPQRSVRSVVERVEHAVFEMRQPAVALQLRV